MNPIHNTGKQMADKADQALTQMGGVLQKAAGQLHVSDMQADLTRLIRKYPTHVLLAGLSLGFLTGAVLTRR